MSSETVTAHGGELPVAFLPVVTKAREIEARVLLAAHLVRRGFRVVVGRPGEVDYRAAHARNGVYFSPLLVPATEPRLAQMRARGHAVIGWDEEGLVYPDPDWYFANRISPAAARHADVLIGWGSIPSADLKAALPPDLPPVLPLGNGRIDLLLPPYRQLYADAGRALAERFGRYVLVNTNFDLVNHVDGPDGLLRRMRASGRLATERDADRFAAWGRFRQAMFDAFLAGLPRIAAAVPELTFVIRNHPSESAAPYRALAADVPNLTVEPPAGPAMPWIAGATAILHNSCTTAVEAFLMGVPVIAFDPPDLPAAMDSPLPNLLSRRAADWDAVIALVERCRDGDVLDWVLPDQHQAARDHIGGLEGQTSSDRLAELAAELVGGRGAHRLGRPDPVRRLRRGTGMVMRALRLRTDNLEASRHRFTALSLEEMVDLNHRIGTLAGHVPSVSAMRGNGIFLMEPGS